MKQTFAAILLVSCALPAQSPAGANGSTGVSAPVQPLLELRILASTDDRADGVDIDLAQHELRLRAWLDAADNRSRTERDPNQIQSFNALPADRGGPPNPHVRWFPHVIRPAVGAPDRWEGSIGAGQQPGLVPLFSAEEHASGPGDGRPRLVELVAINTQAKSFSAADLDAAAVRAGVCPDTGLPAVFYALAPDKRAAYADWSEEHIGDACAIVIRGEVRAAPVFRSRIVGQGMITGSLTEQEARELARALAAAARMSGSGDTVVSANSDGPVPAGADPADLAAMQGAQAMLEAEKKLRDMIKAGKIAGIDRILTFDEISSWPYEDGLLGLPGRVKKLDGQNVLMTGFMLPIDEVENIREFLLVQSLWSCCYGSPPDINGFVRVVMKGDARIDYQFDPIKVTGTFKVQPTLEDGYCVDIYQLRADAVEVIK